MTLFALYLVFFCALKSISANRVGIIQNASLSMNCSHLTMTTSTCNECLCTMLYLSQNLSILSMNCHVNSSSGVTCELFTTSNYISSCLYRMENNSNSTFYFQQLPSTNQSATAAMTTVQTLTDTTTTPLVCDFSCVTQLWNSSSSLLASWTFDGTFGDQMNKYNLSSINSPSFFTNGFLNEAISFNASANQSLSTSYIPLANKSFTINAWINPTEFRNQKHHSIFGVCPSASSTQCLHITIRNRTSYFGLHYSFHGENCMSYTPVVLNKWMHVGFTLDMSTMTRFIYINGQVNTTCSTTAAFMATEGNSTIGHIPLLTSSSDPNFFQGYIDQLTISHRVKSACEILDEATLVARFTFNNGSLLKDSGSNTISANASSYSIVASGHSFEAISFIGSNSSYFQTSAITIFGVSMKAFSISLWIQPQSLTGILVHSSSTSNSSSGWCFPFLGFNANGSLIAQIYNNESLYVIAPTLVPLSPSWSHIVQTWSSINGLRLYINNVLVASLPSAVDFDNNFPTSAHMALAKTLPAGTSCRSSPVVTNRSFAGAVDDFIIYRRELSTADICNLYIS